MTDRAAAAFLLTCMVLHGLGLSVTVWFRRRDRRAGCPSCGAA